MIAVSTTTGLCVWFAAIAWGLATNAHAGASHQLGESAMPEHLGQTLVAQSLLHEGCATQGPNAVESSAARQWIWTPSPQAARAHSTRTQDRQRIAHLILSSKHWAHYPRTESAKPKPCEFRLFLWWCAGGGKHMFVARVWFVPAALKGRSMTHVWVFLWGIPKFEIPFFWEGGRHNSKERFTHVWRLNGANVEVCLGSCRGGSRTSLSRRGKGMSGMPPRGDPTHNSKPFSLRLKEMLLDLCLGSCRGVIPNIPFPPRERDVRDPPPGGPQTQVKTHPGETQDMSQNYLLDACWVEPYPCEPCPSWTRTLAAACDMWAGMPTACKSKGLALVCCSRGLAESYHRWPVHRRPVCGRPPVHSGGQWSSVVVVSMVACPQAFCPQASCLWVASPQLWTKSVVFMLRGVSEVWLWWWSKVGSLA